MALPVNATHGQHIWYWCLRAICTLGFVFLLGPIIAVIPISFSSSSFLSYPLPGFSTRWYEAVLEPFPWMFAVENSIIVAVATTIIATILGTLAAYGLTRADFPGKALIFGLLISPLAVPLVITALGLYFFFARIGLVQTHIGLIVAHVVLATPFVVITVSATLRGFDWNLVRAAESLGASPLGAFFQVTLPLIMPGVLAGAIFAFVTSLDEIVVALFISGPAQSTLPRQLFTGLRDQLDPSIVAIASLLIAVSVTMLIVVEILHWRNDRLQSRNYE
ncbi:MAG: ABC transporter permease [Alphaproteobacteria bacterium]|jgi:putative spermidine/putrescine transport system permease protein